MDLRGKEIIQNMPGICTWIILEMCLLFASKNISIANASFWEHFWFFFEGDYTLDIDPVMLEDDAVFQCQVGAADGVSPIRSRDANLTVNVPPEPPIIINGDTLKTIEDREVEVKCVSRGGKPAAEVSLWLIHDTLGWQFREIFRVFFWVCKVLASNCIVLYCIEFFANILKKEKDWSVFFSHIFDLRFIVNS